MLHHLKGYQFRRSKTKQKHRLTIDKEETCWPEKDFVGAKALVPVARSKTAERAPVVNLTMVTGSLLFQRNKIDRCVW
jgi:hypothetical protein